MLTIKDVHIDQVLNYSFGDNYSINIESNETGHTVTTIPKEGDLIRPITIHSITKEINNGKFENKIHICYKLLEDEMCYELNKDSNFIIHVFESEFFKNVR